MQDFLSQSDIERLFTGPAVDVVLPAPAVAPLAFGRPGELPPHVREHAKVALERLAPTVASAVSSFLRTAVGVSATGVERLAYRELESALDRPCAAAVFELGGRGAGRGVAELDLALALALVDRLLGGTGAGVAGPRRAPSALESSLLGDVLARVAAAIPDAIAPRGGTAVGALRVESDPARLAAADGDVSMLVFLMAVTLGGVQGPLTVAVPLAALEGALAEAAPAAPVTADPARRAALQARLEEARVTVAARLPVFHLGARDILRLAPGMVLDTGHDADDVIEVRVNGTLRFHARVGQVRRRLGLQVVEHAEERAETGRVRTRQGRIQ